MHKAAHRLRAYLKRDFREIVNPTSLPNPPEYVPPEKFSWTETWRVSVTSWTHLCAAKCCCVHKHVMLLQIVQEANRKYRESWQSKEQPTNDNSIKDPTNSSLKDDLCKCTAT